MKFQALIPLFIYLSLLFIYGYYQNRSVTRGMQGFLLGDRKINHFAVAISSVISARGAWLILGVSAQAYLIGLSSVWMLAGFILSEVLVILYLAPALHSFSQVHGSLTLGDVLTDRFSDNKKSLRIIVTIVSLFFSICFISAQFLAGGNVFYAFLGITLSNGIIITGVISLLFVFSAGFKSLNNSDFFNSILILGVLISIPVIIQIRREGFENLHAEILPALPDFFNLKALSIGSLAGFLSIGLGSTGNPNFLLKYMSLKEPGHFRQIAIVSTLTSILIGAGAILTGIYARTYFPTADTIPGADSQNLFIGVAGMVFTPLILGIVLVSVLGSVISSSGSLLLFSSSAIVNDIYNKSNHNKEEYSMPKLSFYNRLIMLLVVYFAILAGLFLDTDLYRFMLFSFAGLGASLGPAIIFTLFWKDATSAGISAGVICGGLTVIAWRLIPGLSEDFPEFLPGFLMSAIAILLGSIVDKDLKSRKFNRKANYIDISKVRKRK